MLGRLVIRPYAAHSSVWTTVLGSVCCLIMYNLETEQHYTASPCIHAVAGEVDTSTIPNNITCGSQSLSTFC